VRLLLGNGAGVEQRTLVGSTSLSSAAANGHTAVLEVLLEKVADIDTNDNSGRTPLMCTAING
jgi:uncharacterized protein